MTVHQVRSTTAFLAVQWNGSNVTDVKEFVKRMPGGPYTLRLAGSGALVVDGSPLHPVPPGMWLVRPGGSDRVRMCTSRQYAEWYAEGPPPTPGIKPADASVMTRDTLISILGKAISDAAHAIADDDWDAYAGVAEQVADAITQSGTLDVVLVDKTRTSEGVAQDTGVPAEQLSRLASLNTTKYADAHPGRR